MAGYSSSTGSAFTFIVLIRSRFRNQLHERRRLAVLLEDITDRYQSPVILGMCKKNNVSVMQSAVISDLITPVIFDEYRNAGSYINVLMKNVATPYCIVVWDDMRLEVRLNEQLARWLIACRPVCAVPYCYDEEISLMPTVLQPELQAKKEFSVNPSFPDAAETATLFPYDYTGIYHTETFFSSAGFDADMDDGFWQLADFGLSCWERAMRIIIFGGMSCRYLQPHTMQYDQVNQSWKKFEAKHFGYTIRQKGKAVYSAKARRTLKEWLVQLDAGNPREPAPLVQEADKLITFWGNS